VWSLCFSFDKVVWSLRDKFGTREAEGRRYQHCDHLSWASIRQSDSRGFFFSFFFRRTSRLEFAALQGILGEREATACTSSRFIMHFACRSLFASGDGTSYSRRVPCPISWGTTSAAVVITSTWCAAAKASRHHATTMTMTPLSRQKKSSGFWPMHAWSCTISWQQHTTFKF